MPIRDWPKRKLVRFWVGGALLEAVLLVGPSVLQPSAETLDRGALALQESVRAGMGPAINLDTLSKGQRDSLVSLARGLSGRAVAQAGKGIVFVGIMAVSVYLLVPATLIVITVVWLRGRTLHKRQLSGVGA